MAELNWYSNIITFHPFAERDGRRALTFVQLTDGQTKTQIELWPIIVIIDEWQPYFMRSEGYTYGQW